MRAADGEGSVEDDYTTWVEVVVVGMETLPLKKPPAKWAKIRSQRTQLDLIEAKIADLQSGAKEKPDWPARKKIHQKLLARTLVRSSTVNVCHNASRPASSAPLHAPAVA